MEETLRLRLALVRGGSRDPLEAARRPGRDGLHVRAQPANALSDRLALLLRRRIGSGALKAGDCLPSERAIAQAGCISRVTVRSALGALRHEDLLASGSGSGRWIVTGGATLDRLGRLCAENEAALDEVDASLRGWVAGRAAERACPRDIDLLLAAAERADWPGFDLALAQAGESPLYALIAARLLGTLHGGSRRWSRRGAQSVALAVAAGDRAGATAAAAAARTTPDAAQPEDLLASIGTILKTNVAERVAAELEGQIDNGRVPPGTRLPGERSLADQFGVSRASIRTALDRLKGDGLIHATERSGTVVVAAGPAMTDRTGGQASLAELIEMRATLEMRAVRRAADQAGDAELRALGRVVADMKRPNRAPALSAMDDFRFHAVIARASGCAAHLFLLELLRDRVAAMFDETYARAMDDVRDKRTLVEHHAALGSAIATRDEIAAGRIMAEHTRFNQEAFRRSAAPRSRQPAALPAA